MAETKTPHDPSICGARPGSGPPFGRKNPNCPRCKELLDGAPARELSAHRQAQVDADARRKAAEAQNLIDMREHFASLEHRNNLCNGGGPCTRFDW